MLFFYFGEEGTRKFGTTRASQSAAINEMKQKTVNKLEGRRREREIKALYTQLILSVVVAVGISKRLFGRVNPANERMNEKKFSKNRKSTFALYGLHS